MALNSPVLTSISSIEDSKESVRDVPSDLTRVRGQGVPSSCHSDDIGPVLSVLGDQSAPSRLSKDCQRATLL